MNKYEKKLKKSKIKQKQKEELIVHKQESETPKFNLR
jgi:hypothetical protein